MLHRFDLNGYFIAVDVYSGAVLVLDEPAYEILGLVAEEKGLSPLCPQNVHDALDSRFGRDVVLGAYRELYEYFCEGMLFTGDAYEEIAASMGEPGPVKAMCLHLAHDCNLRCRYCFAQAGDYGVKRGLMPLETAKRALDFLLSHSGGRRNLEVDFFGGEPLMNYNVMTEAVKYGNARAAEMGKRFRFTVTTNGLLLDDEKIDFINEHLCNVVLSMDGRPQVHDRMRKTKDGRGSHSIILDKYKRLVERRGGRDYYVRATFTRHNLDFADDVMYLVDEGFKQVSVEPVVADTSLGYALTEDDIPRICEEYDALAKEIIARKRRGERFSFFHFAIDLSQGPCVIKRIRGCGCGNEYIAVTPEGDIYPCHQFVGEKEFLMGNVHGDGLQDKVRSRFAPVNIYTKEDCRRCWAKFYCSGGCYANNHRHGGGIDRVTPMYCELEKKRIECAIMIKAALAESPED